MIDESFFLTVAGIAMSFAGLGVGIGEHLGYLFTGSWTILTGVLILGSSAFPGVLGWLAVPIGIALLIGALEFVGPTSPRAGRWPSA